MFSSVSVFILTSNETNLLRKTLSEIMKIDCFEDIDKITIVAKNKTCPGYLEAKKIIEEETCNKINLYVQKSATVELCLAELPPLTKGSHFIIMVADMEMDPRNIQDFIKCAKKHPERIICAAKWMKGSVIEGYGKFHELGSRIMNSFVSLLFNKHVKDPFTLYQIYPISVYEQLNFKTPSTFAYEYTVKALHNDIEYEEIPTTYKKRSEGNSNFNYVKLFSTAAMFCLTAVKIRFSKKENS